MSSTQVKVELPSRFIKRRFGYIKFKYRGFAMNSANLVTLFSFQLEDGAQTAAEYGGAGMSSSKSLQKLAKLAKEPRTSLKTPRSCSLIAKR